MSSLLSRSRAQSWVLSLIELKDGKSTSVWGRSLSSKVILFLVCVNLATLGFFLLLSTHCSCQHSFLLSRIHIFSRMKKKKIIVAIF